MKRNVVLVIVEIFVMGGVITAFVAPLLSPSNQETEVKK